MMIDSAHFSPWLSLAGGVILGIATSLFVLGNSRILGVSGIVGGLLALKSGDMAWRLRFLAGVFTAPVAYYAVQPDLTPPAISSSYGLIILAGLLVGLGTRFASGCTSGHGICGMSRLSPRSIVATLSFMAVGFAMVFVLRHLL